MRRKRYGALALAGILSAVGTLSACQGAPAVKVISVAGLNSGYYGGSVSLNGFVTDNASQSVYLEENRSIEEIYVSAGEHVAKGQPLAAYDKTSLLLKLEEEQLKNQSLQLKIQKCRQDLAQLEQGKIPAETIIKKDTTPVKGGRQEAETTSPAEDTAYGTLTDTSIPRKGEGTKESPYLFLVKPDCAVMGSFFNEMADGPHWFRLEVREENEPDNTLLQAWNGDGSRLKQWHPESRIILENLGAVTELKEALKPEEIPEEPTGPEETEPSESQPDKTEPGMTEPPESQPEETDPSESRPDETSSDCEEPQPEDPGDDWYPGGEGEWDDVWGDGSGPWDDGGIDWGMGDWDDTWLEEPTEDPAVLAEEIKQRKADTEKELRSLTLQARQSDLNKNSLERDLEQGTINSAVDGVVKMVKDPRTESVSSEEPMIQVVSQEGWYIQGECKETMLPYVRAGDCFSGYSYDSGISFEVEIQEISRFPSIENTYYDMENASYYPFIASVGEGETLKKGEYIELTVPTNEPEGDGIYLSQAFIRRGDGADYVMKKGPDGTLVRQEVTLGRILYGESYEILSGLTAEDSIAFPYGSQVKEGAKTEEQSANDFWEETYG